MADGMPSKPSVYYPPQPSHPPESDTFFMFSLNLSRSLRTAARCYVVIMKNKHLPGIMLLNGRRRRLLLVTFPNSFAMLARCVVFEPGKRYQEASLSRFVMQHE
jgi:hypothetical protein